MTEQARQSRMTRATQAAEGLPRWRWTTAELLRLTDLGAFTPEDQLELIGGEIVPISPQGRRHEIVREEIERALRQRETADVRVVAEPQLNLTDETYTKPDILVRPSHIRTPDVRGDTALLVIEVADSSLAYDQEKKTGLYARFGVRDYWVVNAQTLQTRVHRTPCDGAYASAVDVAASRLLSPLLVPALLLRLADLDLD